MNIKVAFKQPMRRWQLRLADKLRASGHRLSFEARGRREAARGVAVALAGQRLLFGPRLSLLETVKIEDSEPPCFGSNDADLVLALDGVEAAAGRVLEPLFDGRSGESALLAMVVGPEPPVVQVRMRDGTSAYDVVAASPAIEDRSILSRGVDQVLARLITLLLQAVRRLERAEGQPVPAMPSKGRPRQGQSPIRHIAGSLAHKIGARLTGAPRGPNHWRVGYRRGGMAPAHRARELTASYSILPDDGRRFYADPFPFEHEGRSFLFLEDYPYATATAVIAVAEIDAAGRASTPRTVLEGPCHLSYPYIIRHRGEIYMLPEMSGAGRVQLFRADPFPDRWVTDRILLDGVVAADATPIEHEGRWWMFATLSDDGGSSWDQLCLFHAPDLLGPWTAHADNPVLVDAGCARPAGAMWHEDGVLMRVAQDCRAGYGVGLAICRVDRLDERDYSQTVTARLAPPGGTGADGAHTLNRAGDLEVIDLRFSRDRDPAPSRDPRAPPSPARG